MTQPNFHVLMVCTGNICRSVMAHQVLAEALENAGLKDVVTVDSCGISNEEAGNPPDPRAQRVLREHGHNVPTKTARKITPDDITKADLILAMTGRHLQSMQRTFDLNNSKKLRMYREFDPAIIGKFRAGLGMDQALDLTAEIRNNGTIHLDVPDPWYGGYHDFEDTLTTIERVTPNIVAFARKAVGR